MNRENLLKKIEAEMGQVPKPLDSLSKLDMNTLIGHLEGKKNAYAGNNLDMKTKALIALGVGIALDSQGCIMNNIQVAKKNGATTEEIMEAYAVAKFSKSSSSISGFAGAMEWLLENQASANE